MSPAPAGSTSSSTSSSTRSPKHPLGTDAEGILQELTTRQHLAPHRPLKDVVADVIGATGVCPAAAERAVAWLSLSPDRPVGRLRRGELIQLARSMYRFWIESLSHSPAHAASAPPTHQ